MTANSRLRGFRGEFLWEFEIVERQLSALAEAIPEERYDWRPAATARSVSEVFVHIAVGNFILLDVVGAVPPVDIYGELSAQGPERLWTLVRKNDELGETVRDKTSVAMILQRSFESTRRTFLDTGESEFDRQVQFFGEDTTVRRVYLRSLAHMHEHMGQVIAYARCMGMNAPWPDWRSDRR